MNKLGYLNSVCYVRLSNRVQRYIFLRTYANKKEGKVNFSPFSVKKLHNELCLDDACLAPGSDGGFDVGHCLRGRHFVLVAQRFAEVRDLKRAG